MVKCKVCEDEEPQFTLIGGLYRAVEKESLPMEHFDFRSVKYDMCHGCVVRAFWEENKECVNNKERVSVLVPPGKKEVVQKAVKNELLYDAWAAMCLNPDELNGPTTCSQPTKPATVATARPVAAQPSSTGPVSLPRVVLPAQGPAPSTPPSCSSSSSGCTGKPMMQSQPGSASRPAVSNDNRERGRSPVRDQRPTRSNSCTRQQAEGMGMDAMGSGDGPDAAPWGECVACGNKDRMAAGLPQTVWLCGDCRKGSKDPRHLNYNRLSSIAFQASRIKKCAKAGRGRGGSKGPGNRRQDGSREPGRRDSFSDGAQAPPVGMYGYVDQRTGQFVPVNQGQGWATPQVQLHSGYR
jgi:hypothetical protein